MELRTQRLRLIALTSEQLALYLADPQALERQLGFPVSRVVIAPVVRQAIEIKLSKMAGVPEAIHVWYTYWLIVTADERYGAGLAGFKGYPDSQGEAEIGYGIDLAYRRRGYMTETVRALIAWAFEEHDCTSVIAPDTLKSNVASNRVLEKAGMTVYQESDETLSWRIDRRQVPGD